MSNQSNIYSDISLRTGGDIYVGIVGPVRTGKSTFIKQFMDKLVLPNIADGFSKERANDELPQASAGRTIMTTEPKFIPENAVTVNIDDTAQMKVRLIDCVGYIVPSSLGYIEGDEPRMVRTPWYDKPIPFNMAAEIGTKKVITEHSTIGLVITTDGSISDIPREEYAEAEMRVINELKEINKPFIVVLNCANPKNEASIKLAEELSEIYGVTVLPINCLELTDDDIKLILGKILYEFPIAEITVKYPKWINSLPLDHWLRSQITQFCKVSAENLSCIKDLSKFGENCKENEYIENIKIDNVELGKGRAGAEINVSRKLFYDVIKESTDLHIAGDNELLEILTELSHIKKEYMRIKDALNQVEATGYGIVMPTIDELSLKEPEIIKQGGRYGVKLCASAPSIHMIKANITTEVNPIVGSEKQSEDLIRYLLSEFEENPVKIWDSDIFGKSLHELVNEGLHTKLAHMPSDARMRLQETLERVINEGCNGLVCIIL